MPDLHFSIFITGSAETLFALLADLLRYDRWLSSSKVFGEIRDITPLPVGLDPSLDVGPAGIRHGEVIE